MVDPRIESLMAPPELTVQLLDLVNAAANSGELKKGANETTKVLNRDKADLIIIAADTEPLEIVLHLPLVCEDKNVMYVYVNGKSALGRACGVSRSVIAAAIALGERTSLREQVDAMQREVQRLMAA